MAVKKKALTIGLLEKEDKKLDEVISIEVQGYSLEIDRYFRKTKINNLIKEMIDKIQYAKDNDIDLEPIMTQYSLLMVIKHFSSLDIPEDLEDQVKVLDLLADLNLLGDIGDQFPEDQVAILKGVITDFTAFITQEASEE